MVALLRSTASARTVGRGKKFCYNLPLEISDQLQIAIVTLAIYYFMGGLKSNASAERANASDRVAGGLPGSGRRREEGAGRRGHATADQKRNE
mmetsp:Transcript_170094/g.545513  ORF Transcript_170094/g.545513 Transcript_170094/m.545513 type:complete len:93 (-) Transcript_170094:173-451(-)